MFTKKTLLCACTFIFTTTSFVVCIDSIAQEPQLRAAEINLQEAGGSRPSVQDSDARKNARRRNRRQKPTVFWPEGIRFDRTITTPQQHFGFDIGQRHLRHDQIVSYLQVLDRESDRVSLHQYGLTHGKRPLLLATITSPKNHQNLDSIRESHRKLAKPDKSASVNTEGLPVVMNMGYSVHGDEPSAGNCSPLVAYYLAAALGDEIEETLDSVIVLLDPTLNPDGFDRFARWANTYRGRNLNGDPQHAEHVQGWPTGRVNYYWFDLNRDWLPLVHPESQNRMKWYHAWKPNIVLDFHEMGTNSTFFFQPGVPSRTNPLTPQKNVDLTTQIADFHVKAFDGRKEMYFTQEVFDDFYMGKGSTYPDLHGAIGILFEQASSRGHLQESDNGLLSFPMTIRNQFTASRSSLEAATRLRDELLDYKRSFYTQAMESARADETQVHVFRADGNKSRIQGFADLLLRHDIQCYRLKNNMRYGDHRFAADSTLVVPTAQPEYIFLRSLLEKRTEFEENIFYDVSAWTIPLAYNLEHHEISKPLGEENLVLMKLGDRVSGELTLEEDDVAYLIDWRDDQAPKFLYRFLNQGMLVKMASRPITVKTAEGERTFGYGTLMVPMGVAANQKPQVKRLLMAAAKQGLDVQPVKTGLTVNAGIDLGSNNFRTIDKPQVAMFVEQGVRFYEAGEVWHALDTRIGMPVSLLKNGSSRSLARYNTIIMVSGNYDNASAVEAWVRDGGTLITIGSAVNFAEGFLNRPSDDKQENGDNEEPEKESIQKRFVDARNEQALRLISGAIFRAKIDTTHPLFYGYERDSIAVFRNHARVLPQSTSPYGNPLIYAEENPLLAGYASQENQEKLAGTAGIVVQPVGRGRVIMMTDNMNFRGFWLGTQRAFFNSIFFGQFTNPPRGREE